MGPNIEKAGKWDITIQQGSTFERVIRIPAIDVSEYSFRGQIRKDHKTRKKYADFSFDVLDSNSVVVTLTAAQTTEIPSGVLYHDIEIYLPDDVYVARILEGTVKNTPEITKD